MQSEALSVSFAAQLKEILHDIGLISTNYSTKVLIPDTIAKSAIGNESVQARIEDSWNSATVSLLPIDPFLQTAYSALEYESTKVKERVNRCAETLSQCLKVNSQFIAPLQLKKDGIAVMETHEREELIERLRLLQERLNFNKSKLDEKQALEDAYRSRVKSFPVLLTYVASDILEIKLSVTNFRSICINPAYLRLVADPWQTQDVQVGQINPGAQVITFSADQIDFNSVQKVTFTLCWGSDSTFREMSKPLIVDFTDEEQPNQQGYENVVPPGPDNIEPSLYDDPRQGESYYPYSSINLPEEPNASAFVLEGVQPAHSIPDLQGVSVEQAAQAILQEFPNAGTEDQVSGWFRNDPGLTYQAVRDWLQSQLLGQSQSQ